MKQYFILDGLKRIGPYNLEQLKAKSFDKQTPVWYEGLEKLTTVGNLTNAIPDSTSSDTGGGREAGRDMSLMNEPFPAPESKTYAIPIIIGSIVIGLAIIAWFINCNN